MTLQEFCERLHCKSNTYNNTLEKYNLKIKDYNLKTLAIMKVHIARYRKEYANQLAKKHEGKRKPPPGFHKDKVMHDGSDYIKAMERRLEKNGISKKDRLSSGAVNSYVYHGRGRAL